MATPYINANDAARDVFKDSIVVYTNLGAGNAGYYRGDVEVFKSSTGSLVATKTGSRLNLKAGQQMKNLKGTVLGLQPDTNYYYQAKLYYLGASGNQENLVAVSQSYGFKTRPLHEPGVIINNIEPLQKSAYITYKFRTGEAGYYRIEVLVKKTNGSIAVRKYYSQQSYQEDFLAFGITELIEGLTPNTYYSCVANLQFRQSGNRYVTVASSVQFDFLTLQAQKPELWHWSQTITINGITYNQPMVSGGVVKSKLFNNNKECNLYFVNASEWNQFCDRWVEVCYYMGKGANLTRVTPGSIMNANVMMDAFQKMQYVDGRITYTPISNGSTQVGPKTFLELESNINFIINNN